MPPKKKTSSCCPKKRQQLLFCGMTRPLQVKMPVDMERTVESNGIVPIPGPGGEMFGDTSLHDESCPWQSVFSLAVHPDWQGRGYGRDLLNALIERSRQEGRKGVTLTCLERKLGYYGSFGFENRGVSKSVHGGAVWYDMVLPF